MSVEINDLVAKTVMGWRRCDHSDVDDGLWWKDSIGGHYWPGDLQFSDAWGDAGQVVDRMTALGWGMVHWNFWPLSSVARGHNVAFYRGVYPPAYGEIRAEEGDMGRSFPLAVCLAALKTLGVEIPQ